ncbi:PAAR-like protein [Pedobacter sp. D749]|uniref:PAAR-like protein n=1 Tax=Pedobacter sp. D749 TaxID=2856523 RepID=UPI001C572AF0|nr:PAAR-like protein [Pedobacter sp. D749]QXU40162.1 DUF4280 domain-containing protein [Pedobacter sp. D749]
MAKEYYLNEKVYAYCSNGVVPSTLVSVSNKTVKNKGSLFLNTDSRFFPFSCKYGILIAALLAATIAAVATFTGGFLGVVLLGIIIGYGICTVFTWFSKWQNFHPKVLIDGKNAITNTSFISCPIMGGKITPTYSYSAALAHSGVVLLQTSLDAFLLRSGAVGLQKVFATYSLKMGLSFTAITVLVNYATNEYVVQPISESLTGEKSPDDLASKTKDITGYPLDDDAGAAKSYNDLYRVNSTINAEQQQSADQAASVARNNPVFGERGQAIDEDVRVKNTQINQDKTQAVKDYRKLYEAQAREEGIRGRDVKGDITRQARQSAVRDAALRKEEVRISAENKRAALEAERANAASVARNGELNKSTFPKKVGKVASTIGNFGLNWAGMTALGILSNVNAHNANQWIDGWEKGFNDENVKALGINAVAVNK